MQKLTAYSIGLQNAGGLANTGTGATSPALPGLHQPLIWARKATPGVPSNVSTSMEGYVFLSSISIMVDTHHFVAAQSNTQEHLYLHQQYIGNSLG